MHSGFPNLREAMAFHRCFRTDRPNPSADAGREAAELLGLLESTLKRRRNDAGYLFGAFGAADAFYAPVAVRLTAFGIPMSSTPLAAAYIRHLLADPSVARWMDAARKLPDPPLP